MGLRQRARSRLELIEARCERHAYPIVAAILAAALLLRLFALRSLAHSLYGANLMPDEQVYDSWAREIAAGRSIGFIHDFAPLPAYVFGYLYRWFGADTQYVRALNVAAGTAVCGVLFVLGRQLAGKLAGIASAALAAVYGPFVLASVTAHGTALGILLAACALVAAAALFARPTARGAFGLGAALAAAMLARPNCAVMLGLAPLLLLWLMRRERLPGARLLAAGGSYALAVLCVGMLFARVEERAAGSIQGAPEWAFNFYTANELDNPTPYFRPVRFASAQPAFQAAGFVMEASRRAGVRLSVDEAGRYFIAETFRAAAAQPAAMARKLLLKTLASVNGYEPANNHNLAFVRRYVSGLGLPYFGFGVILALAAVGLLDLRKQRALIAVLVLVAGYWLSLVVFFTDTRLRAPLAALLLPLTAHGGLSLARLLVAEPRNQLKRPLTAAAAALAVSLLPIPGAGDLSTAINFHALFLYEAGRLDEAEQYYAASAASDGIDSQSAYLGLAAIAEQRRDLQDAERQLDRIADEHYKAAEKYERLGAVMARSMRIDDSISAFEQSLAINPSTLRIYELLILLHERSGHAERARMWDERHRYAKSFF